MRKLTFVAVPVALLLAACAAIQQQKKEIQPDTGQFKNLKVLPQNITHDELVATMRSMAGALGTRCEHCHVEIAKDKFDYPSDTKPEKNVARQMMRMVHVINTDYIPKLNPSGQTVGCVTCHQRHTVPPPPPPPAPRQGSQGSRPAPPAAPAAPETQPSANPQPAPPTPPPPTPPPLQRSGVE